MRLTKAERNHLRRLVGYIGCEVGQTPEEMVATVRSIAPAIGKVSPEGKERLEREYRKAHDVPLYIRAAIKALEKALARKGNTVDGEIDSRGRLPGKRVAQIGPEEPHGHQ